MLTVSHEQSPNVPSISHACLPHLYIRCGDNRRHIPKHRPEIGSITARISKKASARVFETVLERSAWQQPPIPVALGERHCRAVKRLRPQQVEACAATSGCIRECCLGDTPLHQAAVHPHILLPPVHRGIHEMGIFVWLDDMTESNGISLGMYIQL